MKRKQMYNFVLTAMISTIVLILAFVPNLGYITIIPGVSITIIHIPVIIGIFLLPLAHSLVLGLIFGLSSLIIALIYAVNPLDQAFIMPWISVLPRLMFALATFFIIKLFNKIKVFKYNKQISYTIVTIITGFALFFGSHALIKNIKINNYNIAAVNYYEAIQNNLTEEEINSFEMLMNNELTIFNETYPKVKTVTTIVVSGLIIVIAIAYYFIILKKDSKYAYIPSVIILSTFLHTIFVIGSIALFEPVTLKQALNSDNLINIILLIALSNGLIEAIVASIIGTPILIGVKERLDNE